MPQTRMRMRPWLEKQINSNAFAGLLWLNKEEKLFQIPWKHAAKHGWDLEKDASLFKSWAIHTGRYKEGDVQPDPKTWKANFRCAMNSLPDIEEVKDKSISKGSSAVRVYRMLETSAKTQKKEKKSKSIRAKSVKKSVEEDIKEEETVEATNSIQLPDDHSGYALSSYSSPEMEVGSTLDLATCDLTNTDWRPHSMEMQLPDSTNDIYPLQVSPIPSSSDVTDEDDDRFPQDFYPQLFNNSNWHQTCVGEKGFLLNETGMQSFSFDLTFQDPEAAIDATNTELLQIDARAAVEFSLMDSLRFTAIPC
ncbi:interferon regulatory factor 1 isoform X1 [Anolis sagrei]|uniref:interferon regulatory factor 1 isoform X1 n=1 Tax=Anolis sagrei TaxID=38937 RepID=UPI00351FBBA5